MSPSTPPRKGFATLLKRIFGNAPEETARETTATPLFPLPRAPDPIIPQVLIPRKGVGTLLRKAVQPDAIPSAEPAGLWALQGETENRPKPAKAYTGLLKLPRTVLSMLKKAPPPQKAVVFGAPEITQDPAFTRRKERDYPII